MRNYFSWRSENSSKGPEILERPEISQKCNNPVKSVIKTFEIHLSIVNTKSKINRAKKVSFVFLNDDDIKKKIAKQDVSRAS